MTTLSEIGFLFDLDGVIIDSETQYTQIWQHIDSLYTTGVENFPTVIKGTTLDKILFDYFAAEVREQVTALCYKLEKEMVYGYRVGSKEFLDRLKNSGIPMALVTSSDEYKMGHLWHDLPELKAYFNTIISGERVTRSKPDPEGYLLAAKELNLEPRKCVVIEDSLQGVKAGRGAGCYVIGVPGTLSPEALLPYCDELYENINDIDVHSITMKLQQ